MTHFSGPFLRLPVFLKKKSIVAFSQSINQSVNQSISQSINDLFAYKTVKIWIHKRKVITGEQGRALTAVHRTLTHETVGLCTNAHIKIALKIQR